MTQRHAVIFVEPGPAFDERLDMMDFVGRGQSALILAHNTEGIFSQIPRSELRPCGVVPAFAWRASPIIVEATWVFVLVLVVVTESVGISRRAAAVFARSRDEFH